MVQQKISVLSALRVLLWLLHLVCNSAKNLGNEKQKQEYIYVYIPKELSLYCALALLGVPGFVAPRNLFVLLSFLWPVFLGSLGGERSSSYSFLRRSLLGFYEAKIMKLHFVRWSSFARLALHLPHSRWCLTRGFHPRAFLTLALPAPDFTLAEISRDSPLALQNTLSRTLPSNYFSRPPISHGNIFPPFFLLCSLNMYKKNAKSPTISWEPKQPVLNFLLFPHSTKIKQLRVHAGYPRSPLTQLYQRSYSLKTFQRERSNCRFNSYR